MNLAFCSSLGGAYKEAVGANRLDGVHFAVRKCGDMI